MAYSNGWTSTDQVAQRAIDQGLINRLGSLDSTDGGNLKPFQPVRQLGAIERCRTKQDQRLCGSLVAAALQRFHVFPRRPVNGDQFSQLDRRTLYGLDASHSFEAAGWYPDPDPYRTADRADDITVGLFRTLQRATLSTVRADNVQEGNVGVWADTTARWTDWLRTTIGVRQDYFAAMSPAIRRRIPATLRRP